MVAVLEPLLSQARPRFQVEDENRAELSDRLITLQVGEDVAGMAWCEATFSNWGDAQDGVGFLYFDRDLLDFGKKLVIDGGSGDGDGQIFHGRVMALEGRFLREKPHEFLVLAEDRLQDLRMTRRSRTFEDSSDADIFSQIAGDHGLQNEVDATGPTHRIIAQVNQSDLAFMRERACAVDAELWIEDNVLHVQSRGRRDMGSAIFTLGQNLLECRICADLAGQVSGLTVSGWDVAGKEAISHRADHQSLSSELGTDDGGSAILDSAIGKRDEQISHLLPTSTEEARSLAEAHYKRVARRFLVGDCLAQGDARIRVGAKLTLESVGPLFEGEYYVTKVCHMFDEQRGFETQFTVERPGIRS